MLEGTRALVPVLSLAIAVACSGSNCGGSEVRPVQREPEPEVVAEAAAPIPVPEGFRAVSAPAGTWGDHVLRAHPNGEVWLISVRSGRERNARLHFAVLRDNRWVDLGETDDLDGLSTGFDSHIDAEGIVHVVYYARRPADSVGRLIHATWNGRATVTHELDGEGVSLTLDGDARARILLSRGAEFVLLTPRSGNPEERGLQGVAPDPEHRVLAFQVAADDQVTLAFTDRMAGRVWFAREGDDDRVEYEFAGFNPRRFIDAAFGSDGRFHAAGDHDDGRAILYLSGDSQNGIDARELTLRDGLVHAHPFISEQDGWVSIVFSLLERDLTNPRVGLFRFDQSGSVHPLVVGPYDHETERYTAATVSRNGTLFIGGWGSFGSGDGLVRVGTAPH